MTLVLFAALSCNRRASRGSPDVPSMGTPLASASDGTPEGSGAIRGSADGRPFPVAGAWVIDSPETEGATLVYLFSRPVRCVDLSFSGWDSALDEGTVVLAIEMFGSAPGSYLAVSPATSSPGEATVQWTRTSRYRVSSGTAASGGWVTLETVAPRGPVTGSFSVAFGASEVTGQFNASFCAGGHEP